MRVLPLRLSVAVPLVVSTLLVACGDEATTPEPEDAGGIALRQAVLADLTDVVILPALASARMATAELATAMEALDAAPSDAALRGAAQDAWRQANIAWQAVELMQVGPTGMTGTVAAGEDLRDRVYSWPTTNRCRIDQETVAQLWQDPSALEAAQINIRGLDAIEYLLFFDAPSNACPPQISINSSGEWDALGAQEVSVRRTAYATALAQLVAADVASLEQRWSDPTTGFAPQLRLAGQSSTVYPTTQAALNALSDAMFYLESDTKDMKVAQPAGFMQCGAERCPEALEGRLSGVSLDNIRANLEAFRLLYRGGPDDTHRGYDDLLVAVGATSLAEEMLAAIDTSLAAADAIPVSFEEALTTHAAEVDALFDAMTALGRLLKSQFVATLDLELPARAAADND